MIVNMFKGSITSHTSSVWEVMESCVLVGIIEVKFGKIL